MAKLPGKTFLLGEYAAVVGEPAVVAALDLGEELPRGFGTSSAEWIRNNPSLSSAELWKKFKIQNPHASGYDVVAQSEALKGSASVFLIENGSVLPVNVHPKVLENSLVFSAVHLPGRKVWTQVDVEKKLAAAKNWPQSKMWVEALVKILEKGELNQLVLISEWAQYLKNLHLEDPGATSNRNTILKVSGVIAAKGCGAGLSDSLWVVVEEKLSSFEREKLIQQIENDTGLICLGTLKSLLWVPVRKVKTFAPVNIAWIKYMGKENGVPTNSSFSLTLNQIGTEVELCSTAGTQDQWEGIELDWAPGSYVPPEAGINKLFGFLKNSAIWAPFFREHGLVPELPKKVVIRTRNNAPAASGVATSASSYAAFTLAWVRLLGADDSKIKKNTLAKLAALGSGSAGRSISGPWVEWKTTTNGSEFLHYEFESGTIGGSSRWVDVVFLFEESPKEVSSSEAHLRVSSSPLWKGRIQRAEKRLMRVKEILNFIPNSSEERSALELELKDLVLNEALDMHELFETSNPPFSYQNQKTKSLIEKLRKFSSFPVYVTLDAGANAHVMMDQVNLALFLTWAKSEFPETPLLWSEAGTGAE